MRSVSAKPDYQSLEKEILELWEKENFFGRLQKEIKGRPVYKFLDGPITANNSMGVHHAWGRTLKDAFIRYKVMNGYDCKFQNGFDCQGLWVEVEVEKSLNINGKREIESYGLDKFAEECKHRVNKYAKVITDQSKRLGQWMDWDNSYYTYHDYNIESIWNFLKVCHQKGWLYKKEMPMPWCPRCGTSLSEHEMSGSHKETTHTAVYAHVPILSEPSRRLLVWTTTPWTLPANTAIAINPEMEYMEVQAPGWNYSLILGIDSKKVLAGTNAKTLRKFKGQELVGLSYQSFCSDLDIDRKVVPWDEVTPGEGSGLVHIAPGCGLEDYQLGLKQNLKIISPIDENGKFYSSFDFLSGLSTSEATEKVILLLDSKSKLFKTESYTHPYPVCWRCKEELVFRLVSEWFISSEEIKPKMIETVSHVKWNPEYIGKRMEDWLQNMGDWCISRKRYWGLPLPFYQCEDCHHLIVIGSKEELKQHAVEPAKVDALKELHRPWIDEIKIICPHCLSPDSVRVTEVGDCWLDAGIVPYSTNVLPADWVCEMREQVRLWFYSMLFMGVTLDEQSPYKEVLAYERVVAEDGSMFSKTGFMINFNEAVEKMSADTMRYLYCRQSVASDLKFGYESAELMQRKMAPLWNIYNFFVTYALVDDPTLNLDIFDDLKLTIQDKWLLARTQEMVNIVQGYYEQYDTLNVVLEVEKYLEEVSNFYVRANRRRFWEPHSKDPEDKRACYSVLFHAIKTTSQVMAPIIPFQTEFIWQNLVLNYQPWISSVRNFKNPNIEFSIHASSFPKSLELSDQDKSILESSWFARDVISQGMKLRGQAQIRVRQPLGNLFVICDQDLAPWYPTIESELNVKNIHREESIDDVKEPVLKLNFKKAGPLLKQNLNLIKELLETHQNLSSMKYNPEGIIGQFTGGAEFISLPNWEEPISREAFSLEGVLPSHILVSDSKYATIIMNKVLSPQLISEGYVRDFVRAIQVIRKESGMAISDRISIKYRVKDDYIKEALKFYRDYIAKETLSKNIKHVPWLAFGNSQLSLLSSQVVEVGDHQVAIQIKKVR